MATKTLSQRAQEPAAPPGGRLDRILGHPLAYLGTVVALLLIFGGTFLADPGRPAPADDPAYYAWRTEALIVNDPVTLLEVDGPKEMYSGGYRVTTPVIAAVIRRLGSTHPLTPTVLLAVGLRVAIPLLLAGLTYRRFREPLLWHAVAFGSASMLITPMFGGYLDNILTLFFITAALFLFDAVRTSWLARFAFATLLFLSGLTHPTTLVIFCGVLGLMSGARLILRRFALKEIWKEDAPVLLSGLAAAVATYVAWKIGIWGESALLSDAALPPPASSEFFKTRLDGWVEAIRPVLNGPLLLAGLAGLLARRKSWDEDFTLVSVMWLAPLVGVLGFLADLAFPYYRFFNTTVAWLLLIGLGIGFIARYLIALSQRGGIYRVALLGIAALVAVIATNLTTTYDLSQWNNTADAWIKPDERTEMDALRPALEGDTDPERPVVFVVDNEAPEAVRIYGFAKLAGNVSRYGVPGELLDRTAFYLGSLEDWYAQTPSERGDDEYYRELSEESLKDAQEVMSASEGEPITVLAASFNESGANVETVTAPAAPTGDVAGTLIAVRGDEAVGYEGNGETQFVNQGAEEGGLTNIPVVLAALSLMMVPGWLLMRRLVPDASLPEVLGLVPAFGTAAIAFVGIAVLAVVRSPFTGLLAWVTLLLSVVGALVIQRQQTGRITPT